MKHKIFRPALREISVAAVCLIIALGGAFFAASATSDKDTFKLTPPCARAHAGGGNIENKCPVGVPNPDFQETQRLDLHRTFFTAWAALILAAPAFCLFWFRHDSETAAKYWLAFWTISLCAFLVHLYWAAVVLFDADAQKIFVQAKETKRVTAPRLDVFVVVWWGFDVLLAWLTTSENRLVRFQRFIVHLLLFALFVVGSAKEGERTESVILGVVLATAVLTSFAVWFGSWLKRAISKLKLFNLRKRRLAPDEPVFPEK